jgi:hypothetical protein
LLRVGPLDSRSPHISRTGARVPIPSGISTILSRPSSRGRQTLMPYTNTRNQQIRSIISVTSPQNLIFSNTASLRFPAHRVVSMVQLEPVYRLVAVSPYYRFRLPPRFEAHSHGKRQLPVLYRWFQVASADHEHSGEMAHLKIANPPQSKSSTVSWTIGSAYSKSLHAYL